MSITGDKHTSPLKYRHFALARIDGSFPIDAFRYDRCFPLSEQDSQQIEQSLNFGEPTQRRYVFLAKDSESAKEPWFWQFWDGQSRVRIASIGSMDIPAIRHRIDVEEFQWIQDNVLYIADMRRRR